MPKTYVADGTPLRPVTPIRRDITPAPAQAVPSPEVDVAEEYQVNMGVATLRGGLGTREDVLSECKDVAAAMRAFHLKSPDQVMSECSAYSARMTELAICLFEVEATDSRYTRLRTMVVQRIQEELDRQTKIASRLIEQNKLDWEMTR